MEQRMSPLTNVTPTSKRPQSLGNAQFGETLRLCFERYSHFPVVPPSHFFLEEQVLIKGHRTVHFPSSSSSSTSISKVALMPVGKDPALNRTPFSAALHVAEAHPLVVSPLLILTLRLPLAQQSTEKDKQCFRFLSNHCFQVQTNNCLKF